MRRQLFIVRTSGARLLALINDVMDAATLRQHRLVLKQEKLELRQVVGDVVDLTRSLVSLRAGMCWKAGVCVGVCVRREAEVTCCKGARARAWPCSCVARPAS